MIEKKIHYCWFGRNPLPPLAQKCINSWRKYCPDYEIIEWNEDNFDVNSNRYVKEAYAEKKYAFVTDYVRLYALYNEGGIYMDTDVEVLKPLNQFLEHSAFTGVESEKYCVTGIIGAKKNHPWVFHLLNEYNDRHFRLANGELDITTNTDIITRITMESYGWEPIDKHQKLKDGLNIYPFTTFCAKDWRTGLINVTEQTYTIHHFSGSWIEEAERKKLAKNNKIKGIIKKVFGDKGLKILLYIKGIMTGFTKRI